MIHEIGWHDLEFPALLPARFFSSAGVPQMRWEPVGMPYIPQGVINGAFYLYQNAEDAEAGRDPGGTGFIVMYDGFSRGGMHEHIPGYHFYGVTNWHVALQSGCSVIRLNRQDGKFDIIDLGPHDWFFMPGKHDIAVVPINIDQNSHDVSFISTRQFCEKPNFQNGYKIGVGDDVFMIGLFVDHAGMGTGIPSARFGNISMMPSPIAKIRQPTGYEGESYVVDMHSRTGFSGSPVYVYRTFGSDLTESWRGEEVEVIDVRVGGKNLDRGSGRIRYRSLFKLLGILWGQFPERWQVKAPNRVRVTRQSPNDLSGNDRYIEGMSGMSIVIPAWDILEVLQIPKLSKLRQPDIFAAENSAEPKPMAVTTERSVKKDNPNHQEDVNRLGKAAAKPDPNTG